MEFVVDTVTIVRHLAGAGKIGAAARQLLDQVERGEGVAYVSAVSLAEILYLSEKRRITVDLADLEERLRTSTNFQIVDLDFEVVLAARPLRGLELHDRLIVATAISLNVPIVTCDEQIKASNLVEVIWS